MLLAGVPSPPLPACVPLHPQNTNGSWYQDSLQPSWLHFAPAQPCQYSISSPSDFFARFHGRTLAFVGDSQVREFTSSLAAHMLRCCWMQQAPACNHSQVLDAAVCKQVELAESYPKAPVSFSLRDASGHRVTLVYSWLAYPREGLDPEKSYYLLPFLAGNASAQPDALLMSWGHWDLIFSVPRRSDNLGGRNELLAYAEQLAGLVQQAAAARPAIKRVLTWRQLYPDEVDALPHPQFRKRMILPSFRAEAREGLRAIWEGKVGLRVWDPYAKLDVRAGGVQRAWNENMLTLDGMHLKREVDVELAWELLSYWAEAVVGPALPLGS